jgi:hypothetical protein
MTKKMDAADEVILYILISLAAIIALIIAVIFSSLN